MIGFVSFSYMKTPNGLGRPYLIQRAGRRVFCNCTDKHYRFRFPASLDTRDTRFRLT